MSDYQHSKYTNVTITPRKDNEYYISPTISDGKKCELLDEIGEDFVQSYLRKKKIDRILKR